MLPVKTILYATDFSRQSRLAFRLACALARDYSARLVIMTVAETPLTVVGEGGRIPSEPLDVEELRDALAQIRPSDSTTRVEHRLVEGEAATEILRMAKETKCDVIVMGTHGRTGLGRFLMGSVAERVLRKAACPVLTVKMPSEDSTSLESENAEIPVASEQV